MAGVPDDRMTTGVAYVATHVSPMSRLMTWRARQDFEPTRTHAGLKSIPIEGADDWEGAMMHSA